LHFFHVGLSYECEVNNNPNITTEESAKISGVSGTHKGSRSNDDDVQSFHASWKTIQFFPKGLDKFFINLKFISIHRSQLKEIHQSDLKGFPNLTYFYLSGNEIEVIEEGLFDFNPHLEAVGFDESKIIHIDPNVFDHLNKLRYFWFDDVPCLHQKINYSREKVQEAIKVIRCNCSSSEFWSLDNKIKSLESDSETFNYSKIGTKIENFVNSFKNSKFSRFRLLNYKLEKVKNAKCTNCRQLAILEFLDTKIVDLHEILPFFFQSAAIKFSELNSSLNVLTSKVNQVQSTSSRISSTLDKLSIHSVQSEQKDHRDMLSDLKTTQNEIHVKIDEVSSQNVELKLIQGQIKMSQIATAASIVELNSKVGQIRVTNLQLSFSLNGIIISIGGLKVTLNAFKDDFELSQKNVNISLSEISQIINEHKEEFKINQNEVKDTLKSIQDQVKLSQDTTAKSFSEVNYKIDKLSSVQNGELNAIQVLNGKVDTILNSQEKLLEIKSIASEGIGLMSNAASTLASGASILASGASAAASGASAAASGVSSGVSLFASGASLLASGASLLASGVSAMGSLFTSSSKTPETCSTNDKILIDSLEDQFVEFKAESSDKLTQIEKELTNILHKLSSQTNLNNLIDSSVKALMNVMKNISSSVKRIESFEVPSMNVFGSKINDILATLNDHTNFQIEAKDSFVKIKTVQDEIKKPLNDLSIKRNEDSSKLDKVGSLIEGFEGHFADFKSVNSDKLGQIEKKFDSSVETLMNVMKNISSSVKRIESFEVPSMNVFGSKINDILATLNDHTNFQIEAKDSFVKIKTVQDEIKKSLNDLSIKRNEDSSKLDKVGSLIEGFEGHFADFKAENSDKLGQIEKKFDSSVEGLMNVLKNISSSVKRIESFEVPSMNVLSSKISEIVALLNDHTRFQTETRDSFDKIRIVQNEIKRSMNDFFIHMYVCMFVFLTVLVVHYLLLQRKLNKTSFKNALKRNSLRLVNI